MSDLFERGDHKSETEEAQERKIAELYQEIGRLTTQVNWLEKNYAGKRDLSSCSSMPARKAAGSRRKRRCFRRIS